MFEVPLSPWKYLSCLPLCAALACGGGSAGAPFLLEPEAPVVAAGEQLRLTARTTVDLSGELAWEVQEPYGGGLLRSQGPTVTYVAPDSAGTYHLQLRAPGPDGRPLKQIVAVQVLAYSTLEPSHARVAPGGSVAFTAHFRGLGKGGVRWSVQETGGGQVSDEGRYTAPDRPGTYHVTASSTVDAAVRAQATVVVEP